MDSNPGNKEAFCLDRFARWAFDYLAGGQRLFQVVVGFIEKVPEAEIVVRCDLLEQEVALPLLPEWCSLDQPPPPKDLTGLPLVNQVN